VAQGISEAEIMVHDQRKTQREQRAQEVAQLKAQRAQEVAQLKAQRAQEADERKTQHDKETAELKTQREQAAALRKGEQATRHAQYELEKAARVTNQAKAKIEAAQEKYNKTVKDVPTHMMGTPYGAAAQSRRSAR
jgi:hypothetical protein